MDHKRIEKEKKILLQIVFAFFFILLFNLISENVFGQTYGLKFYSHNVLKENRTNLDLNPDHFFTFNNNFEVTFNFSLNEYDNMYFGYILRIIDSENKNIDLIFTFQSPSVNGFEIVYGENLSNRTLKTDFTELCRNWTELRLNLDIDNHNLIFSTPDTSIIVKDIQLTGKVKILFGASDYNHFKTNDVPPMNIKDIRISEKGKVLHEWPLDEQAGSFAYEKKSKKKALVSNPDWLSPRFHDWKKLVELTIEGNAEVAYNAEDELIYIIGDKKLLVYSVAEDQLDSIIYDDNLSILKAGCQAFYDSTRHLLVTYNIDLKTVSTFDLNTKKWTQTLSEYYPLTVYWHHNKFYSAKDSIFYAFGGYGQHEYKNSINRFSFPTRNWDIIQPNGESYYPRYLSALGHLNDSIYILGGYGSLSGKQILNPQNFYDLWIYSLNENNFSKIYEFSPPEEDVVFANSLVINAETREFYALAFPNFKYESYLQLYKGSLNSSDLVPVGNKIPYLFHDIISFADLFFIDNPKKLVAVTTLFQEDNNTTISLYSIGFPPNKSSEYLNKINTTTRLDTSFYLLIGLTVIILFLMGYLYLLFKRKRIKNISDLDSVPHKLNEGNSSPVQKQLINSILFFGGFQILNKEGDDITQKFSPLVKELFLLIWLYSVKDKGISSERLIEILWFDKDEKSAKNNLAVNIAKIKQIIKEIESIKLTRPNKYWKLTFDDKLVFNDYWLCIKLTNSIKTNDIDQIQQLILMTIKGHFLENCSFGWLDEFKANISNLIIDTLLSFVKNIDISSNTDLVIQLADTVLNFESMNEEAVKLKCKSLILNGKHQLAKETYCHFTDEYKLLYNINYDKSFLEMVGGRPEK